MNLQELQKQIIDNNFNDIYIFIGDEIAIQKIYINKIAETAGLELQYIEEFKQIYNKLSSNDILNTKKVYVILDDIDYIKQEKIWNEIKTNGNIVIFKYNTLDKRSKFYKTFSNDLVEFNRLSDDVLTLYIKKQIPTLSELNCKKLIDICNGSYNQILLELDKLQQYSDSLDDYTHYNNHFEYLDSIGAFHKEVSDITFEFIEKVMLRDIESIYKLRLKLQQLNESNIKLLSLLYNNFKTILLIQSCKSSDICKTTGLQYYQVKYNKDKTNIYTIGELVYILKLIQRIEKGIKTGLIDEIISLDYLLVNIL